MTAVLRGELLFVVEFKAKLLLMWLLLSLSRFVVVLAAVLVEFAGSAVTAADCAPRIVADMMGLVVVVVLVAIELFGVFCREGIRIRVADVPLVVERTLAWGRRRTLFNEGLLGFVTVEGVPFRKAMVGEFAEES